MGSAIWSILREAASRGISALADILVTFYCVNNDFSFFAWNDYAALAVPVVVEGQCQCFTFVSLFSI